jgi:hypothetical protein
MKEQLKKGRKKFVFTDFGASGINIFWRLIADANNTAPLGVDLGKVSIKAVLDSSGTKYEIFNSELKPLQFHSTLISGQAQSGAGLNLPSTAGVLAGDVAIAHSSSVKGEAVALTYLPFGNAGQGIICKDGDRLEVEIYVQTDAYHANCDNDSYLMCELNDAVVQMYSVPTTEVHSVPANQSRYAESLGDNVTCATLISVDKTNDEGNSQPYTDVKLESDKLTFDRTFTEQRIMNSYASQLFNDRACAVLHNGHDLDGCKVSLDLISSRVNDDENFIVVNKYVADFDVLSEGAERQARHQSRNASKLRG